MTVGGLAIQKHLCVYMVPCDGLASHAECTWSQDKLQIHCNTYQDKAVNSLFSLFPNIHRLEHDEIENFKEAIKPPILCETKWYKIILQTNGIKEYLITVQKGTFH